MADTSYRFTDTDPHSFNQATGRTGLAQLRSQRRHLWAIQSWAEQITPEQFCADPPSEQLHRHG